MTSRGARASVELRGTPELPAVGRPLLTAGRWLDPENPDGVVLDGRLARYKTPAQFVFVDALPRNASGKVLRTDLRGRVNPGETA